ncbi:uncharacterized protein LOC112591756 [Melanaphis sacchari]|uniref:uncharacterized protein LOC112591756 n=1 Tax=Melanaphis sacchari TaxID=742174 RepID=UPI000DC1576F|nr:uncharacterized protein LOC112591756 [Melanaphis sacchari]
MTVSFGCPASRVAYDRFHVEYEKSWLVSNQQYNEHCYLRSDLSTVDGRFVTPTRVSSVSLNSSGPVGEYNKVDKSKQLVVAEFQSESATGTDTSPGPVTASPSGGGVTRRK